MGRLVHGDGRRRELIDGMLFVNDRLTKQAHYERLGVASYWLLDPRAPSTIEVLELMGGRYESRAQAVGDETVSVDRPFPGTVSPARLLDGLRRA